jgi:hypothetical protein
LFSVGLVSELGTSFHSEIPDCPGYCEFRSKDGVKVLEGQRVNRLYPLDFKVILPSTVNVVTSTSLPSGKPVTPKSKLQDLLVWHQRMGHVNIPTIQRMSRAGSLSDFYLEDCSVPKTLCYGCLLGKQHKEIYKTNPQKTRAHKPGSFLHGDTSGKMGTLSINGAQYYYLLKDDATSYCFVHFSANKDEAFSFFKRIFRIVQRDTGNTSGISDPTDSALIQCDFRYFKGSYDFRTDSASLRHSSQLH